MGGRGASSESEKAKIATIAAKAAQYITDDTVKPFSDVSRGQAGMIFKAYKNGEINATQQQISLMYDRYTRGKYESARPSNDGRSNDVANKLRATVAAVAAGDIQSANYLFKQFLDSHYMYFDDKRFPDDRKRS